VINNTPEETNKDVPFRMSDNLMKAIQANIKEDEIYSGNWLSDVGDFFQAVGENAGDFIAYQGPASFYELRGTVRSIADEYLGFDEIAGRSEAYKALGFDPEKLTDIEKARLDAMPRADIDRMIAERLRKREISTAGTMFKWGSVLDDELTESEREELVPFGQGTFAGDLGSGLASFMPSLGATLIAVAGTPVAGAVATGAALLGMGSLAAGSEISELRRTAKEQGTLDSLSNEKELLVGLAAGSIEALGEKMGIKGLSRAIKPNASQLADFGRTVRAFGKGNATKASVMRRFTEITGRSIATGMLAEGGEEAMVELATSGLRAIADYGPDRTTGELLSDIGRSAAIGGILGGGTPAVQSAGQVAGLGRMSPRKALSPEQLDAMTEEQREAYESDVNQLGSAANVAALERASLQEDAYHTLKKNKRKVGNKVVDFKKDIDIDVASESQRQQDLQEFTNEINKEAEAEAKKKGKELQEEDKLIVREVPAENLTVGQKIRAASAKKMGRNAVFYETGKMVDGEFVKQRIQQRGAIGSTAGTVYVDSDAAVTDFWADIFMHEATHGLEKSDYGSFTDLKDMFLEPAKAAGDNYLINKYSKDFDKFVAEGMTGKEAVAAIKEKYQVDPDFVVREGLSDLFGNQENLKAAGVMSWLDGNKGRASRIRDYLKRTFVNLGIGGTGLEKNIIKFIEAQKTATPTELSDAALNELNKERSQLLDTVPEIQFSLDVLDKKIPEERRKVSPDPRVPLQEGKTFEELAEEGYEVPEFSQEDNDRVAQETVANSSEKAIKAAEKAKVALPPLETVQNILNMPSRARYWYELSSKSFTDLLKLPKEQLVKTINILSATSGGERPDPNMRQALSIASEVTRGVPIMTGTRTHPTTMKQALSADLKSSKFGNFVNTFLYLMGETDTVPLSTNDRQVAALFNVDNNELSSDDVYEYISNYYLALRDVINEKLPEGAQPFESWQLQALGWVAVRPASQVKEGQTEQKSDDYAQSLQSLIPELKKVGVMEENENALTLEHFTGEKGEKLTSYLATTRDAFVEAETLTFEVATKQVPEGEKSDNIYRFLKSQDAKVPRVRDLLYKYETSTLGAIAKDITSNRGKKGSLAQRLVSEIADEKIQLTRMTQGLGTYEGQVTPNIRIPLRGQRKGKSDLPITTNIVKALHSLIGVGVNQDAMASSTFLPVQPDAEIKDGTKTYTLFLSNTDITDSDAHEISKEFSEYIGMDINAASALNGWEFEINAPFGSPDVNKINSFIKEKIPFLAKDAKVSTAVYNSNYTEREDYVKILQEFLRESGRLDSTHDDLRGEGSTRFANELGNYFPSFKDLQKVADKRNELFRGFIKDFQSEKSQRAFRKAGITPPQELLKTEPKLEPEQKAEVEPKPPEVQFSVTPATGADMSVNDFVGVLPDASSVEDVNEKRLEIVSSFNNTSMSSMSGTAIEDALSQKYGEVLSDQQMSNLVSAVKRSRKNSVQFSLSPLEQWRVASRLNELEAELATEPYEIIKTKTVLEAGEKHGIAINFKRLYGQVIKALNKEALPISKATSLALQGKTEDEITNILAPTLTKGKSKASVTEGKRLARNQAKMGINRAEDVFDGKLDTNLTNIIDGLIEDEAYRKEVKEQFVAQIKSQREALNQAKREALITLKDKYAAKKVLQEEAEQQIMELLPLLPRSERSDFTKRILNLKKSSSPELLEKKTLAIMDAIEMKEAKVRFGKTLDRKNAVLKRIKERVRKGKVLNEDRESLGILEDKLKNIGGKRNRTFETAREAYDTIEEVTEAIDNLVAKETEVKDNMGELVLTNKVSTLQAREDGFQDVQSAARKKKLKPLKPKSLEQDPQKSGLRTWAGRTRDLARNIAYIAGGKNTSLYKNVVTELKLAEERAIRKRDKAIKEVDAAARRAGFDRGLSELRQKATEVDGNSRTVYDSITVNGETYKITLGQALHLLALDPQTLERMSRESKDGTFVGAPMVFTKAGKEIMASGDSIRKFRSKILREKPELIDLVETMKEQLDNQRFDLFRAKATIEGKEPEAVYGYWPLKTVRETAGRMDIDEALGNAGPKAMKVLLTNVGFLTERKQNNNPVLITDAVETFLQHSTQAAFTSEFAVPAYNAMSILNNKEMRKEIIKYHGENTHKHLLRQVMAGTRLQIQDQRDPDLLDAALNNLSASVLTFNEGTWYRMLFGGVSSLLYHMNGSDIIRGIRGGFGQDRMNEMLEASPYIADRLFGFEGYARFSARAYGDSRLESASQARIIDTDSAVTAVKGIADAFINYSGVVPFQQAIRSNLKGLRGSIRVLQGIDSFICLTAYNSYLAQADGSMTEAEKRSMSPQEWAGRKASDTLRETQNVTSPLDDAGWATEAKSKSSFMRAMLLFSSDPLKKMTMMMEGIEEARLTGDKSKVGRAFGAVSANMAVNAATRGVSSLPIAYLLSALFGGNDEDMIDLMENETKANKRMYKGAVQDVASLFPFLEMGTGAALTTVNKLAKVLKEQGAIETVPEFMKVNQMFTPSLRIAGVDTMTEALDSVGDFIVAGAERDASKAAKAINDMTILIGNPAYIPMSKFLRGLDSASKEEKVVRLGAYLSKQLKEYPRLDVPDEIADFVNLFRAYSRRKQRVSSRFRTVEGEDPAIVKEIEQEKETVLEELLMNFLTDLDPLYERIKTMDIQPIIEDAERRLNAG